MLTVRKVIVDTGLINDKTKICIKRMNNRYICITGEWYLDGMCNYYNYRVVKIKWDDEENTCKLYITDEQEEQKDDAV